MDIFQYLESSLESEVNQVEYLNLLTAGSIPKDCKVLVITALKNDIEVKIIQYESGIQVMDCEKPDILILDIEMEHIDGLKVRDLLEQTDNEVLIIFCTSHDEIMSKAYGRNVTDFIKKPVREEEIEKKLLHAINIINRRVKWICLNTISGLTKFKISDIVYGIAQEGT